MVEPAAVALDPKVLHAVVLQDTLAMTVAQLVKYNHVFFFISFQLGEVDVSRL